MRTESTPTQIPLVNSSLSSSEVLERYWKSWQYDQSKTMGEIMSEMRTGVRCLPDEARKWLMFRFTRVL